MDQNDITVKNYLSTYLARKSTSNHLKRHSTDTLKPGLILELQTRIDLLTTENAQLAQEKLQLELDYQEVEK
jgi:hypothetical protein